MSYVTNAILAFFTLQNKQDLLNKVNAYFDKEPGFNFVNNEGGTKCLECDIATGAFNYLCEDELIEHLKHIDYKDTLFVQLFLCHENDSEFRIFGIFKSNEDW